MFLEQFAIESRRRISVNTLLIFFYYFTRSGIIYFIDKHATKLGVIGVFVHFDETLFTHRYLNIGAQGHLKLYGSSKVLIFTDLNVFLVSSIKIKKLSFYFYKSVY